MKLSRSYYKLVLLVLSILVLTACGPVYQTNYTYIPPKSWSGKQCINTCLQNQSTCNLRCTNANQYCRSNALAAAIPQYKAYAKQQRKLNQPLDKSVDDFADYSSCQNSCGCDDTYRQCYTNCGGRIIANTVCVAFCNQKKG